MLLVESEQVSAAEGWSVNLYSQGRMYTYMLLQGSGFRVHRVALVWQVDLRLLTAMHEVL